MATSELLNLLRMTAPDRWGMSCEYGELKAQGLGRMLANNFNIRSERQARGDRPRGYYRKPFEQAFKAFGLNA